VTSIFKAGFEPTFPASELPQTFTLDRAATGIGGRPKYSRIIACFKTNSNLLTSYPVVGKPRGAVFLMMFVKKVLHKTGREEVEHSWRKLDNGGLRDLYSAKYY
jgi:hypothetical protein